MKKPKKRFSKCITLSLVFALLMVAVSGVVSANNATLLGSTPEPESIHEKIDISEITGEIAEPPMLTSAASSIAEEKEWYEYIFYSDRPVGYAYLSEGTRIAFYDPYQYSDSMIMEVDDSITDWSSNNSLQVSYTTGDTMTETSGRSDNTLTTVQLGYTDIETTTLGENTVTTKVSNQTDTYNTSKTTTKVEDDTKTWSINASLGGNQPGVLGSAFSLALGYLGLELNGGVSFKTGDVTQTTTVESTDGSGRTGYSKSDNTTTVHTGDQKNTVETTIADRVTNSTGFSTSSSISLSTNNSTTITKTYDATHFNANGSPLQWKIIQYTVKMPMKYQVEYLVDNEWVFGGFNYCLLTTIQGTTRSWIQNNVVYYEHWGTGEAVTWDEFWNQFFTEERLIAAYRNRLYPDN